MLPNLRFLVAYDAELTGESKGLLPQLRCLTWMGRPAFAAASFRLEKLVILNLSGSDISELWEGWSHLKGAKQLKVLNLTDCNRLKVTPDLAAFRKLEILILEGCVNLEQIHASIGEAKGLNFLNLEACWKLEELPQEMGKLEELKELYIGETALKELPPYIDSLKKLEVLHVSGCEPSFRSFDHDLPSSTRDLNDCFSLFGLTKSERSTSKVLRIFNSNWRLEFSLHHIPKLIGKLEWLTKLNLSFSGICELPESVGDLKNLKILDLSCSKKLRSLPSSISKLGNLEELCIAKCTSLEGEIHIEGLSSLKILQLSETRVSGFPGTFNKLSGLQKLEVLEASGCTSLEGEIPVDRLSSLEIVQLRSTGVSGFPDAFDKLSRLERLELMYCQMLQSLPQSIGKLPSLQHLDLGMCHNLQSLPELPACLTFLNVTCQHRTLPQLSHLIHLKLLAVTYCRLLESMPELPSGLLELHVIDCDELKELPSLSSLALLSRLHLESCEELTEIKDLEALKSLAYLTAESCEKLSNLDGLEHLWKNLRSLVIRGSTSIETLPDLSCFNNLRRLDITGCPKLRDVRGLEKVSRVYK